MGAQALDQVGGPAGGEAVDVLAQIAGAEAGDGPLAAGEGEEQPVVGIEEQVEAAQRAAVDLGRCRHLGQRLLRGVGIVETGHEGEVAVVGGVHELAQVAEAVDRFAQWGELEDAFAVALFHVAVVLEERDIVDGALHARDQAGLVVELDAGRAHVMADAGAFDAGGEVVADLALGSWR